MVENPMAGQTYDDPRRLRGLLDRARDLAREHAVSSVVVGLAGVEGDLVFPDFVSYLQSALRVEDAIIRLTRERAVVYLADLDLMSAQEVHLASTGRGQVRDLAGAGWRPDVLASGDQEGQQRQQSSCICEASASPIAHPRGA